MSAEMTPDQITVYNDPKYRCCCRCCHVKFSTIGIGTLMGLGALIRFFLTGIAAINHSSLCRLSGGGCGYAGVILWIEVLFCGGLLVSSILLIIGVWKKKPRLMIPFLVYLVVLMVLLGMIGTLPLYTDNGVFNIFFDTSWTRKLTRDQSIFIASLITGVLVSLGILLWFFWVVFRCYRFTNNLLAVNSVATYTAGVPTSYPDPRDNAPQGPEKPNYPSLTENKTDAEDQKEYKSFS